MKKLCSQVLTPQSLGSADRSRMLRLMCEHYDRVSNPQFFRDLLEKSFVILLRDQETRTIQGFSTVLFFDHLHRGQEMRIAFSGDTIIRPEYWGTLDLPIAFSQLLFVQGALTPQKPLWWMLISKGFRTYRYLPVFLKDFYPRFDRPTPHWESGLMRSLGECRYPKYFDADTGTIRFGNDAQTLKAALGEISSQRLAVDPHISFFQQANPGHARGDELLCIAPFIEENFRPSLMARLRPVTATQA